MKAKKQNFLIGLWMCCNIIVGCGSDGGGSKLEAKDVIINPKVSIGESYLIGRDGNYDYSPTMMIEKISHSNFIYRLWWCGNWGGKGDHILYSESTDGLQFSNPVVAYSPDLYDVAAFDRDHTCDPSVIKVDGTYYLYYSGLNNDRLKQPTAKTYIGVAKSTSPVGFMKVGELIAPYDKSINAYGAGQPSVFHKDGYYYIGWHDNTGPSAADPEEGKIVGQKWYISKSTSPEFDTDTYNLVAGEWVKSETGKPSPVDYYIGRHANASMSYIKDTDIFVLIQSQMQPDYTKVIAMITFDSEYNEYDNIPLVSADWAEGVGISTTPQGALIPEKTFIIYPKGALGSSPWVWDLWFSVNTLYISEN